MPRATGYLLDVNVVLALLDERHAHHAAAEVWFDSPGLRWSLCAFTEAGVLRFFTRPKTGGLGMGQATAMLERLKQRRGYFFQPIPAEWQTLTAPFSKRIHGHNQVTDAYLLGLAIQEGLVLTTFDKAVLHLAGEHKAHVLVLGEQEGTGRTERRARRSRIQQAALQVDGACSYLRRLLPLRNVPDPAAGKTPCRYQALQLTTS